MLHQKLHRLAKKALRKILHTASRHVKGTITNVVTDELVVALTFDDGPDPYFTPRLLEILNRQHVPATFFMIGKLAAKHPEIVQQVARMGHAIGNHSWDHASFPALGRVNRWKQILASGKVLKPYGQRMFRPPKGKQSLGSWIDVSLLGYRVVTWSVGAEDWLDREPGWMVDHIAERLMPGSIIVLHDGLWDPQWDGARDRQRTLEAVDMLLNRTNGQYQYVTLPALLKRGRPRRCSWIM